MTRLKEPLKHLGEGWGDWASGGSKPKTLVSGLVLHSCLA